MSGYWHTVRISRDGSEVVYRPPSGATEAEMAFAARLAAAVAAVFDPLDPPTVELRAVRPRPTVGEYDKAEDEP